MTKLERGMMVNVYEDPFTCKKLEGRARLTRRANYTGNMPELEWWFVEFPDDAPDVWERAINPETALEVLG